MEAFKIKRSTIAAGFLLLCLCLLLTGCEKRTKTPLTLDNLEGKRIGVMTGYSTDYILSKSGQGLEIYRYNAYADILLGLEFNRLDALALEMDDGYVLCRLQPEYKIGLIAVPQIEYGYMFSSDQPELLAEFNRFIKDFKETEDYDDVRRRVKAAAVRPFVPKQVENIATTDRVITVGVMDGWEPVSYINNTTKEWEGGDVELITRFANHIGAKIEFKDTSWEQSLIEIAVGELDLLLCPDSLMLAKDLEMNGNITMTDPVFLKDIVLIVKKEE